MVRIARLVGLDASQETTGRTRSVSEAGVNRSCCHRDNSTFPTVWQESLETGMIVVTKLHTRFILPGPGVVGTMMFFFSVDRKSSWTLSTAHKITSLFPRLCCHAVFIYSSASTVLVLTGAIPMILNAISCCPD